MRPHIQNIDHFLEHCFDRCVNPRIINLQKKKMKVFLCISLFFIILDQLQVILPMILLSSFGLFISEICITSKMAFVVMIKFVNFLI